MNEGLSSVFIKTGVNDVSKSGTPNKRDRELRLISKNVKRENRFIT